MTRRAGIPVRLAAVVLVVAVLDVRGLAARGWFWSHRARVTEASIRGHMEMLASDALNGRGSGSRDEWLAATYIASELRKWGVTPLGDAGDFVQRVDAPRQTWNVLGKIDGRQRLPKAEVILLSAHLDHLGVRGTAEDRIYNGADDDASGSAAVLELARVLASGKRPERTVIVAWFGSEEAGGLGARHFLEHPPAPLTTIVANLEFEMIGRPDPVIAPAKMWLTGWERSTLGPAMASHGARVVADPHPAQNFFMRSDNIQLARRGVVAQTVSSYGLHKEYHTPQDDLAHIDFAHMTALIQSLVEPIHWLANSKFVPTWRPGGQPDPVR